MSDYIFLFDMDSTITKVEVLEDPLQAAINIMTKEYLLYKKGK